MMEAFSIETEAGITIPVFLLTPGNSSVHRLAANELMLGRTMTGSRLKDTRTVFRWLANRPDIDPKNIVLWGDSFSEPNAPDFRFDQSPGQQSSPVKQRQAEPLGPFLAILTALYEESVTSVACRGGLISFSSALEDNFCHLPQDVIVPGPKQNHIRWRGFVIRAKKKLFLIRIATKQSTMHGLQPSRPLSSDYKSALATASSAKPTDRRELAAGKSAPASHKQIN